MKIKDIDKYINQLDKEVAALNNKVSKETLKGLKSDITKIRRKLRTIYSKYEVDGEFEYLEFDKYDRKADLDRYIASVFTERYKKIILDTDNTLNTVAGRTVDTMINITDIKGIKKVIDTKKTINADMAGLNWTERYGKRRIDVIYDVQSTIKKGLQQGDTYTTISKELQSRLGVESERIDKIVRTESHRVLNDTKIDSFKEINKSIPIKKKWISVKAETTRDAHADLDGTIIPIDEDFTSSLGGVGPSPGNLGNAADDINCLCTMSLVIEQ